MRKIDRRVLKRLLIATSGAASIMLTTSGCFYSTTFALSF
jgi:hypothetical protein